jgi:hypothetical protein
MKTIGRVEFDRAAAVTRSLLGYGVIAGPIYVLVGLVQALVRDGFDLSKHSLSLLANGSGGWVHILNLILAGLFVLAAAVGFVRAMRPARGPGIALGIYGACLILSGVFVADRMDGFPPGTPAGVPDEASVSGVLHLALGGIGFIALAVFFVLVASWFAGRGDSSMATRSRIAATVIAIAFLAGAATAMSVVGVALIWVAVLAGFGWLLVTSVATYRTVPHPDGSADV